VINFTISMERAIPLTVVVTDALGRTIATSEVAPGLRTSEYSLDLSDQARGVYHVIFASGGEAIERRVLVGTE
jgi:hypothetical protein